MRVLSSTRRLRYVSWMLFSFFDGLRDVQWFQENRALSIATEPARTIFCTLRNTCREYGIYPDTCLLPPKSISKISEYPVGSGSFGAVYKGVFTPPDDDPIDVAIKMIPLPSRAALSKVCYAIRLVYTELTVLPHGNFIEIGTLRRNFTLASTQYTSGSRVYAWCGRLHRRAMDCQRVDGTW